MVSRYISTIRAVLILSVLIIYGTSRADEVSHQKAVEELFRVIKMEEAMASSIDRVVRLYLRQNPDYKPYRDSIRQFFSKYMSWEILQNDFETLYMSEFTEQEIEELTAFYSTPTGQKSIKLLPALYRKGIQMGHKRVLAHSRELQNMISEKK